MLGLAVTFSTAKTVEAYAGSKSKARQDGNAMSQAGAQQPGTEQGGLQECDSSVSCEYSRGGPNRFARVSDSDEVARKRKIHHQSADEPNAPRVRSPYDVTVRSSAPLDFRVMTVFDWD